MWVNYYTGELRHYPVGRRIALAGDVAFSRDNGNLYVWTSAAAPALQARSIVQMSLNTAGSQRYSGTNCDVYIATTLGTFHPTTSDLAELAVALESRNYINVPMQHLLQLPPPMQGDDVEEWIRRSPVARLPHVVSDVICYEHTTKITSRLSRLVADLSKLDSYRDQVKRFCCWRFWSLTYRDRFFSAVGDTKETREVYAMFKEHTIAPDWSPDWPQMRLAFFADGCLDLPVETKLHQVFGAIWRPDA